MASNKLILPGLVDGAPVFPQTERERIKRDLVTRIARKNKVRARAPTHTSVNRMHRDRGCEANVTWRQQQQQWWHNNNATAAVDALAFGTWQKKVDRLLN